MFHKSLACLSLIAASLFTSGAAHADVRVRGYRYNGSYVSSHYRSTADGSFYNNYSTYPNTNPYTGQTGTQRTPSYGGSSYSPYRSLWGR